MIRMKIKSELIVAVLLCWLSSIILATNNTRNTTEEDHHNEGKEEDHHNEEEELLEHFFERYGDKNGNILPMKICNLYGKLEGCGGNSNNNVDEHGHDSEGEAPTKEQLVSPTEDDDHDEEEEGEENEKCHRVYNVLKDKNITANDTINQEDFSTICPGLYALFAAQIDKVNKTEEQHTEEEASKRLAQGEVWGYATIAITVISLSSLFVIVIIPLLGKSFYNKIMSFLVALAIGCLAGDALLHLIPHSLVPHSEHDHGDENAQDEKQIIFRAFIVFLGIYLFFLVECMMKLKMARRKRTAKRAILYGAGKQQLTQQLVPVTEVARLSTAVEATAEDPEKAENVARRSQIQEFMSEVTSGNRRSSRQVRDSLWMAYMSAIDESTGELAPFSEDGFLAPTPREHFRSGRESHPARRIDTLKEEDSREDLLPEIAEVNAEVNAEANHHDKQRVSSEDSENTKPEVPESHENESNHNNNHSHNHSHHHEKNIDKTTKIASLAWMVIVGDGFHNLADGLAVGAAFSASFASGISTAVAVFCHELPHELGDFAVLVKAGMTVKQAITYNMVSAIISYLGMVVGILIGSNESSISWVLALTAGMFLYISLVDMLPELCTQLAEEDFKTGLTTFFWQNCGILVGVLIMYLISLME